ncbi:MAG TPA: hypothetical protein VGF48_07470 [Thermoanaerobaculia bacterium]
MTKRLLLLPAVGADRRLFDSQRSCAAELHVIEWIDPAAPDEPLAHYAQRLASSVDTSRPFVLGGASFGGMVALQLARHVRRPLPVTAIPVARAAERAKL